MKRLFSAVAACSSLALTSCQDVAPANEEEPVDIVALLKSGDPTVCAAPEVQELALNIAEPDYEKFKADGGEPIRFEAVSATDVNKDINEVTCSANLMAYTGNLMQGFDIGPVSISYKIRPSLDVNGTFVVEVVLAQPIKEAIQGHIFLSKYVKQNEESAAAPEESDPTSELTTDNVVANDVTAIDGDQPDQTEVDEQPTEDADNGIY